eukprot:1253294-Pleurochrysis_carterae.AAC.1
MLTQTRITPTRLHRPPGPFYTPTRLHAAGRAQVHAAGRAQVHAAGRARAFAYAPRTRRHALA